MKKCFAIGICVLLGLSTAFSATSTSKEASITVKGAIIDNHCAAANKDSLASFVPTHTKQCATMPDCAASGYSIYSEGQLVAIDTASWGKVKKFLKNPKSTLNVAITGVKKKDGEIKVTAIKNDDAAAK
jgi:hypothetical protein